MLLQAIRSNSIRHERQTNLLLYFSVHSTRNRRDQSKSDVECVAIGPESWQKAKSKGIVAILRLDVAPSFFFELFACLLFLAGSLDTASRQSTIYVSTGTQESSCS